MGAKNEGEIQHKAESLQIIILDTADLRRVRKMPDPASSGLITEKEYF